MAIPHSKLVLLRAPFIVLPVDSSERDAGEMPEQLKALQRFFTLHTCKE